MSSLIAHITLQDLNNTYTPPSQSPHPYKSSAPPPLQLQSPSQTAPGSNAQPAQNGETPVIRATTDARNKGYDGIAIPLANEKWKERWGGMCLLPTGDTPDKSALEIKAEAWRAKPGFTRDEVTVTRLGE